MNFILFAILIVIHQIASGLTAKNPKECFDVLDKLPKSEIKKILFMNFNQVAHTHPATDILSCFLHASHPWDKSTVMQYFDVYKKCDEYKAKNFEPFGYQQLEELVSLGLPFSLESFLRQKIQHGSKKDLQLGILHVQDVMSKDIELSPDYKEYKHNILIKYESGLNKVDSNKMAEIKIENQVSSIKRDIDPFKQLLDLLVHFF